MVFMDQDLGIIGRTEPGQRGSVTVGEVVFHRLWKTLGKISPLPIANHHGTMGPAKPAPPTDRLS